MKKLSILFAALAIVFAATSAFTVKAKKFTTQYEVFGITQDVVSATSPTGADAQANLIPDAFHRTTTTTLSSFVTEKAAFNGTHLAQVECNHNDANQLCGAIITYNDAANPISYSLVDFEAGDYTLQ